MRKSKMSGRELEVLADYEELGTMGAVSKNWGVDWRTVKKALARAGVTDLRKGGTPMRDEYHPMLGIWSDRRVAEDMGISHQAVSAARVRRGVESAWEKMALIKKPE